LLPGQFDWTREVIRVLRAVGLATDVRLPPERGLPSDDIIRE
jgi:fatty-acid desaturase